MILELGADVSAPDGTKLGELRRVAFDVDTSEVVSLVVTHSALDGREVLVPRSAVKSSEVGQILLVIGEDEFAALRDFESSRNVAPPPDVRNVSADMVQEPVDVPDVPPIGAATGIESIAFVPVIQETFAVRVGEAVLAHHTSVYATDGEVGRIKQILSDDESNRIVELVVESGFLFKHDTAIPFDFVENVIDDSVVLTVSTGELEALNGSR